MRNRLTHYHCYHCGDMPRQALQYAGLVGKFPKLFRHYRCGLCGSTIMSESVSQREIENAEVEDHEFQTYKYYYLHFQSFALTNGLLDIHPDYHEKSRHARKHGLLMMEALG